ncbi:hypothetical protein JCM19992_20630 [Thermostilla marina]
MRVYRHWHRIEVKVQDPHGRDWWLCEFGWSENAPDDAVRMAEERVQRRRKLLAEGKWPPPRDENRPRPPRDYEQYPNRPPREEIVREIAGPRGTDAIVTRNSYGALVLCAAELMFVDVDLPQLPAPPKKSWLARLFGDKDLPEDSAESIEHECLARIRHTLERFRVLNARVYRTAGGFRCAVLDRPMQPDSEESRQLMETMEADPLYVRMCRRQECFRARLTPKPWRCDLELPPHSFPFASPTAEQSYREWEASYDQGIAGWSVCRLVDTIDDGPVHAGFEPLIGLHDQLTRCDTNAPLA